MRLLAPFILLSLMLCSCDDNARGIAISGDGTVMANTPEHQRDKVVAHIQSELNELVGPHWKSRVTLTDLPDYDADDVHALGDQWIWPKATVAVELVSDGATELPQSVENLHDAIWEYMRRRVDRAKRNLVVAITTAVDAARFAAVAQGTGSALAPVSHPVAPPTPAPAGPAGTRRYTIQSNDTLADISAAFYGTPDRWRAILQANPELKAAHLPPGTVIVIPPAP